MTVSLPPYSYTPEQLSGYRLPVVPSAQQPVASLVPIFPALPSSYSMSPVNTQTYSPLPFDVSTFTPPLTPATSAAPVSAQTTPQPQSWPRPLTPAHNHEHFTPPLTTRQRVEQLALAGGMIFTGLLLHRLPAHAAEKEFALFPKDWKHWARLLLGLGAVNHINKGMNWNPPPWLQAAETVLVLHPITSGITKRSIGQLAFTLPYVVAIVEANILLGKGYLWAKERFTGQKQDPNQPDTWDSLLFKLASSVAFAAAGVKAYPKLYEEIGKTGILGQANKKHAMDLSSGVALITCARGCCQGTVVCLTEMGEILGGMTSSFQKRKVASSGGQHHGGV